jgi:F-type H+-transporting ATPase subunit a
MFQAHEEIPSIDPHILFSWGPLAFTSSTLMTLFSLVVFLVLARVVSKFKLVPSFFQHLSEMLIDALLNFVASIVGDKKRALQILPYVGSIFLYILFSNLITLVPGLTSITVDDHPLFSATTADFNTTFALALAAVVVVHIVSIAKNGPLHHLSHFIQVKPIIDGFKKSIGDGFLGIIGFFVGLIEVISEVAKVISLSLRLFGNMFAHEVLTIILLGVFSVALPAVWMGMGILVGVVQAIVFTALVTVYYSLMVPATEKNGH